MRSPHHLHGVFDVAPLPGFFGVARILASLGILGRLGDSLEAVLLEHLTRDHVNLYFGYHVALLKFDHAPEPQRPMPVRSKRRRTGSLDPSTILRLSIGKEESICEQAMLVRRTKGNIAQCSEDGRLVPEAEDTDGIVSWASGLVAFARADIRKCQYLPSSPL